MHATLSPCKSNPPATWRTSIKQSLTGLLIGAFFVAQSAFAVQADTAASVRTQSFHSNQIIVKFKSAAQDDTALGRSITASNPAMKARALSATTGLDLEFKRNVATGAEVYHLKNWHHAADLKRQLKGLMQDANIEYAEVDQLLQPLATPNDSRYNEQWHYYESTGGMRLPTAWDTSTGSGVVVAVIDTGYRPHADLAANILPGYDMIADTFVSRDGNGRDADASDPGDYAAAGECGAGSPASNSSWHGTHVAGTVAAVTNNGTGVAGVAYDAKVVPVRVLGRCGGYTSDIADGMIWAAGGAVSGVPANANPAAVLNLSLGGSGSCSSTTQSAIDSARSNGATVVVAAGNSNTNASNANPANCNGVVTVAATNRNGGRSYYSNYGAVVDIAAPGGDVTGGSANGVLSTLNSGTSGPGSDNYSFYQGTSMAAPHVAGLAAMMLAVDSTLTPDDVENTLKNTARAFPASCSQCGSGIVDAAAAVAAVSGGNPPGGGNELTNGVAETGLSASAGAELHYTLEVPAGATNLSFVINGGSGDADLYVRFGSAPTTSTYDCRPYLNGNNETCSIANVQTGTYHVMVRAYSAFSGVSLTGSFDESGGGNGGSGSASNLSASTGQWLHYTVDIPAGMSSLVVDISGGSGDADLYVRYNSQPTTSNYDCRPYLSGNNETCTFSNPQAGTWHLGIRAYSTFSGVTLNATWTP